MNRMLMLPGGVLVLGLVAFPGAMAFASSSVGDGLGTGRDTWSGGVPHVRGSILNLASFQHGPGWGGGGGMVLEHRRERIRGLHRPESYVILKGGGLRVGEDPATDGVFLGFEVGGVVENVLEIGFSTDYFYRSSEIIHFETSSRFDTLPVDLVAYDRTSAHLVPLGLTLRLVLPFAGDVLRPFVSATAAYEMLYLENSAAFDPNDPVLGWLAQEETFTGFGWQASAGARLRVSPSVGLFGEVGYHDSSPSQRYLVDGIPVDLRVDLSGPFLRGGLRFRL